MRLDGARAQQAHSGHGVRRAGRGGSGVFLSSSRCCGSLWVTVFSFLHTSFQQLYGFLVHTQFTPT